MKGAFPAARAIAKDGIVVFFELRIGMFRSAHIVLVLMGLLFAQIQCVAACASRWCGSDFAKMEQVPPCHRHHDHSHDQTPGSCAQQLIVPFAKLPQTVQASGPILSATGVVTTSSSVLQAAGLRTRVFDFSAISPPEFKSLSAVILRI